MCECCMKKEATRKDYRFIDGVAQGKVLVCDECINITDIEYYKRTKER